MRTDTGPSGKRVILYFSSNGSLNSGFLNRCGKRKRSCRERSTDCEMRSPKPIRVSKSKNRGKVQSEDAMDCSHVSSSSISSSDSETGIVTNDEDREGAEEILKIFFYIVKNKLLIRITCRRRRTIRLDLGSELLGRDGQRQRRQSHRRNDVADTGLRQSRKFE